MTKTSKNGKTSTKEVLPKKQVDEAIRAIWDMMEFYIYHPTLDTAKGIKEKDLKVDKLTFAIQKRNLTKEVRSAIKTQLDYWADRRISEPYEITDKLIVFSYKGVPVEFKVLKYRYNFFDYPDPMDYNVDSFLLANPFKKYWTTRFLVR